MDRFIEQLLQGDAFWSESPPPSPPPLPLPPPPPPPVVNRSAFVPYAKRPRIEVGLINKSHITNVNMKVVDFLRKIWVQSEAPGVTDRERCFRHMMSERTRREKQKRSYLALHSLLPLGTKNDKNSIAQTAGRLIEELKWQKEELERRNCELVKLAAARGKDINAEGGITKITVRVANPTSGIDSMVEVLKCLKNLGSKPISIKTQFTGQELVAVVDMQSQKGAAEVEKAVQNTLEEVERKLLSSGQEG